MAEYTKDEALAFIDAARTGLAGKVGFKWYVERLGSLYAYIESLADENERLNGYIDQAGERDEYEAFAASRPESSNA